jgi:gluconolactonase
VSGRAARRALAVLVVALGACSGGGGSAKPDASPTGDGAATNGDGAADTANTPADGAAESSATADARLDLAAGSRDAADAPGDRQDATSPFDAADAAGSDAGGPRTIGSLYCPTATSPYPSPLPVNPQAEVVPIAPPGGISFLEGPLWIAERGVLWVSEWNGGHRILQVTPPSAVEEILTATGSNGLALAPDGQSVLMVNAEVAKTVTRINLANKGQQTVTDNFEGQGFAQPNDLVVRADGTIYFTDYLAGRLYRRATDGKVSLVSSLPKSNGVALSPDEKTLYLNAENRAVRYPLAADGTVGPGQDLVTGLSGADGVAVDCAGNVYIAENDGGAIVVVSPSGTKLGEIGGLSHVVTNAAFGGADRRTLYITTSTTLYAIKLAVPGLPY